MQIFQKQRKKHWPYIVALFVVICIGFFKLLAPQFTIRWDIYSVHYAALRFAADAYHATKTLPLWNPHQYSGYPIVADPQAAMFYPPHLALILLHAISLKTIKLLLLAHLLLAGIGMYAFAYAQFRSKQIAWVAGLVYALSGFFVSHASHLGIVSSFAWLPLACLAMRRIIMKSSLLAMFGGSLIGAMIILAGHFQSALAIFSFLAAYAGYLMCQEWKKHRQEKLLLWRVLLFVLFCAFSLGLSAIQLVPAYEFAKQSLRSDITLDKAYTESFEPRSFLTLFLPNFFGGVDLGRYWGAWSASQQYVYLGIAPLVLVMISLASRKQKQKPFLRFYASAGMVIILFMLGMFSFLQTLFYVSVPFFDKIRAPSNVSGLLLFVLAVCAAAGLATLKSLQPEEKAQMSEFVRKMSRVVLISLGAVLLNTLLIGAVYELKNAAQQIPRDVSAHVIFINIANSAVLAIAFAAISFFLIQQFLRNRLTFQRFFALICCVMCVDLLGFSMTNKLVATEGSMAKQEQQSAPQKLIITQEKKDNSLYSRTLVDDSLLGDFYVGFEGSNLANGYNPLVLRSYAELLNARNLGPDQFAKVENALDISSVVAEEKKSFAVRQRKPAAHAWFVQEVRAFSSANVKTQIGQVLSQDVKKIAWIDANNNHNRGLAKLYKVTNGPEGSASIKNYSPNEILLNATTEKDGFLVLSEVFYNGWKATVDGAPVDIIQTDVALRGIAVPAGEHTIRLFFEPASFQIGKDISGASAAIWLIGFVAVLIFIPKSRNAESARRK